MGPLKSLLMSPEDKGMMRKWARDHGKCVRQRTVRQETAKCKAGTLPLNMYQISDTLRSVGERIVWPFEYDEDQNVNVQCKKNSAEVNMDQASECDTESEPEENENVSSQESSQEVGGKNKELNFPFMAQAPRTRSGRIIRTSFRALLWQYEVSLRPQLLSCSKIREMAKCLSVTRENAVF